MIFTLAWKEVREHQSIWLTMVFMTVLLGLGLAKIVSPDDPGTALAVAALTILGMSAAYGVVCGSMMFAGEHEGGTLVFLDIFLGRRGRLWMGKVAIGIILVLLQALAVALAIRLLQQQSPGWVMSLVGDPFGDARRGRVIGADRSVWFLVLPIVALEAYAWGLFGSSFSQRVLAGATVAAVGATPVWLIAIVAPPQVFLLLRLTATVVILAWSYLNFLNQSQDPAPEAPPESEEPPEQKDRFLEVWREFEQDNVPPHSLVPVEDNAPPLEAALPSVALDETTSARDRAERAASAPDAPVKEQARSPYQVLWWLTVEQARQIVWAFLGACLLAGFLLRANAQVLWPLATLLLGVVCGTAVFAPEQRDLSYQFLAAQHFPLRMIWRFKILFWLASAVLAAFVVILVHYTIAMLRGGPILPNDGFEGTFPKLLGPTLFFTLWLAYGFCTGQLVVWLCAKNILALLVAFLVAAGAIGLWLPSLLCGGVAGWQLWLTPLAMLLATWFLMRAWASGRIKERQPVTALIGFGAAATLWALFQFGQRAWELPDVGAPLDPIAFRAKLPVGDDNAAARAIDEAVVQFDDPNQPDDRWLKSLAAAARLPAGVLERPRTDGQMPLLKHLPTCRSMIDELLRQARVKEPGPAFEHLAQILALSRNLRNKAPFESYLAGVQAEESGLNGLDRLVRGKPNPQQMRQILDELNRHAASTPPPLDCMQTECVRSGGLLVNPNAWTLASPGANDRMRERWLADGIATSLEIPWEAERKTRLWQLVWAGLLRSAQTPHWQLPDTSEDLQTRKTITRDILQDWLPAADGPGAGLTRAHMARLLDASWLADDRLFCSLTPLRQAAIRARWRMDATRLGIAFSLHHMEQGQAARAVQDLVPKYFPEAAPTDPYSGQPFRFRIAPLPNGAVPAQASVWSTGPDRIDHGGHKHGGHLPDDDFQWARGDFDLIVVVPLWP